MAITRLRPIALTALLALVPAFAACANDDVASSSDDITDVQHTDVERQSIGNCWLYAQSSWVESLHLNATGEHFDNSQSYWTYWHWYDQISGYMYKDEIGTGGNQWTSNDIARERGLMREQDFVPEDTAGEMSNRQKTALDKMNQELESGRLSTNEARRDKKLVRDVLDEAWGLNEDVVATLDAVFGEDGSNDLRHGEPETDGTGIVPSTEFAVRYTARDGDETIVKDGNLAGAIAEWHTESYPSSSWGGGDSDLESQRRNFVIRVQRALHDGQPVVITWDVDFNAMENRDNEFQGSFNLTTLAWNDSPGHQGGHMTVLEDYQAVTEEFGLLAAGTTLDPEDEGDAAKLAALLLPSTQVQFLRIKNSWGSLRPDREFAPGFPGYHDLYMDYLNGPIAFCPSEEHPTNENCTGTTIPFRDVMLPPGY